MINILFNEAPTFDQVLQGSLKEGGDLTIVTKDNATHDGNPLACITFTVQARDGTIDRAQAVVTLRNLINALHALMGRYSHLANANPHDGKPGDTIRSAHRGVGYDAMAVREVWLVSIENNQNVVGLAQCRGDVAAVAEGLINSILEKEDKDKS